MLQLKKKAGRHEQHYLVGRSRRYCAGDNELFWFALGHPVYGRHKSLVRQERHTPNVGAAHRRRNMDITTILVIVLIVLLLGGGGFYGRGRWY
ncbi:hypothetical protein [Mesorhizobium caraganae]|uniref:hypothetical protein n=1 Tax=Mesorhizobium caraganae TaxID=483206 RepID=UPI003ECD60DD